MNVNIFRTIAEAGEGLALVTIVNAKGSTPRNAGTRMLVKKDGGIIGTIGGGEVESEAIEQALQVIKDGVSTQLDLGTKNRDILASGMVCGGSVSLWIEYISDPTPYILAANRIKEGLASVLLIDLQGQKGVVGLRDENGTLIFGDGHGNASDYDLESTLSVIQTGEAVLSKADGLFHDPVMPSEKLLILGGGHVGLALSRLAKDLDFEISVGDFRAFAADPNRFPEEVETIHAPFANIIKEYAFTPLTYVLVAGPSHNSDFVCVRDVLPKQHKYLGCLGSKRKIKKLLEYLENEGFEEDNFKTIHAPVGLNIGAETPSEIAASILAELIAVRRGALGNFKISLD